MRYRGSFKGAIRVPSRSSWFLFNDLVSPSIPRQSLKSVSFLFSIPTASTSSFVVRLPLKKSKGAQGRIDKFSSRF
jgi:hypothetical protein